MLEKQIVYRQQIDEFGSINVQKITRIIEDGASLSETYHRHILHPGDSTEGEDDKVIAIANAIWTPEVIAAYQAMMETNEPK
jgi:hypothetical protein